MTSGMASCFLSLRRSTGVYSVAMWRAVVTVDWTTKMSAPASCAAWANRSARCALGETPAGRPPEPVAAELPGDVELIRIDGDGSGNERDGGEPVRDSGLAPPPDPHPHRLSSRGVARRFRPESRI